VAAVTVGAATLRRRCRNAHPNSPTRALPTQNDGMETTVRPVLVFDGDCAFCTSCAHFAQRYLPAVVVWIPWQFADLERLGLTRSEVMESIHWVDVDGAVCAGPAAVAQLLQASSGVWRPLGRLLGLRPVLWAAWPIYRWIARNRHRMPGGTPACAVPPQS
jgi:predicted DCC family thiol-disulfide oxidoreductase YuxK